MTDAATTEALLERLVNKEFPSYEVSLQSRVAIPSRLGDPIRHDVRLALQSGRLADHMKVILDKAVASLIESGQGTTLDHFYLHWGYLKDSNSMKHLKCWFFSESELLDLLQGLLKPRTNRHVELFFHFAIMRNCFKSLDGNSTFRDQIKHHLDAHTILNYLGQGSIPRQHVLAVLPCHAVGRLASEDRLQCLLEYRRAASLHFPETLFEEVADRGWQSLASCILEGISLLPLWILFLHGFDDQSIANFDYEKWAKERSLGEFESTDPGSVSHVPYLRKKISEGWLVALRQALPVVSPHEWNWKPQSENQSNILPIVLIELRVSRIQAEDHAEVRRLVRIEPQYQRFSTDPEHLFLLRTFRVTRDSSEMLWAKFKALSKQQHPFQWSPIHMWRGSETIDFLYLTAETSLAVWMETSEPTPQFVQSSLWKNLAGIASAIAQLYKLTRDLLPSGWIYDIDPHCILLFSLGVEDWHWKLGDRDFDLLGRTYSAIGAEEFRHRWNYVPPEKVPVAAYRTESQPADTWSLGCIILSVLDWAYRPTSLSQSKPLGHAPFWELDSSGARSAFLSGETMAAMQRVNRATRNEQSLAGIDGLLAGMLEINPKKRITMDTVVKQLDEILILRCGSGSRHGAELEDYNAPSLTEGDTASIMSFASFKEDEYDRTDNLKEIFDLGVAVGMTPWKVEGDAVKALDALMGPSKQNKETMQEAAIVMGRAEVSSDKTLQDQPSQVNHPQSGEDRNYKNTSEYTDMSKMPAEQRTFTGSLRSEADLDAATTEKLTAWWEKHVRPQLLDAISGRPKSTKQTQLLQKSSLDKSDSDGWAGLTAAERQRCFSSQTAFEDANEIWYHVSGPLRVLWAQTIFPLLREVLSGLFGGKALRFSSLQIEFHLVQEAATSGSGKNEDSIAPMRPALLFQVAFAKERQAVKKAFRGVTAVEVRVNVAHLTLS